MSRIVRFHRLEVPGIICSMFIADDDSAAPHIRRMVSLGYAVVEETPHPAGRPPMRSELLAHDERVITEL